MSVCPKYQLILFTTSSIGIQAENMPIWRTWVYQLMWLQYSDIWISCAYIIYIPWTIKQITSNPFHWIVWRIPRVILITKIILYLVAFLYACWHWLLAIFFGKNVVAILIIFEAHIIVWYHNDTMWALKIPQPGQVEQKIKSHLSNDCWRFCLWYCYQHDKNVSSSFCNLRLATRVIHILSFTLYLFAIDTVYVFKCLVILISCLYFWRYCDSRIFIRNFTLGTGGTVWFHQGPAGSCCTFRKNLG